MSNLARRRVLVLLDLQPFLCLGTGNLNQGETFDLELFRSRGKRLQYFEAFFVIYSIVISLIGRATSRSVSVNFLNFDIGSANCIADHLITLFDLFTYGNFFNYAGLL